MGAQLPKLSDALKEHGLFAKKNLGQHFLLDSNLCQKIASYAGNVSAHHLIEIGPGPGGLSRAIKNLSPKSFTMVERDERFAPLLEPLCDARCRILWQDALKLNVADTVETPRILLSNLPYNIGTVLLIGWLKQITEFDKLVLMFQKEVAQRVTASVGDNHYGRLAVMCSWLCYCEYLQDVPPAAFTPPPKVDSGIILLTPRDKPLMDVPFDVMERTVARAFNMRRKMLKRIFKNDNIPWEDLDIDPTLRPEQLDVLGFCRLARWFEQA